MNERDKANIRKRYQDRLGEFGANIQALASGVESRREVRFNVLASIGDLDGARVLDLGCGMGDFLGFLQESGISVSYTGYDLVPEFVNIGRERFPGATFEVRDIEEQGISEKFDFIISSQTFNRKLEFEENKDVLRRAIEQCYEHCNVGVVFDMLTSYVDFRENHLFYYEPEEMLSFAKSITKRVTLRHDYPLFEFALFLYKDFSGWSQ